METKRENDEQRYGESNKRHLTSLPREKAGTTVHLFCRKRVAELREKERLRRTFGAHVGRKAAEEILARDPGVGGIEQEITVMFVDIRSFTARAAHLDPHQAVGLLNKFLEAMVEVVESEDGGMINHFTGDGFMALFGVGDDSRNHAEQALATGVSMLRRLDRLNLELERSGHRALAIGIGINTGPAIVGSIGSSERMEFTGIGTTVNVASRIESLNKTLGTTLLLSKATHDALPSGGALHALPPQAIKGVDELVEVFALAAEQHPSVAASHPKPSTMTKAAVMVAIAPPKTTARGQYINSTLPLSPAQNFYGGRKTLQRFDRKLATIQEHGPRSGLWSPRNGTRFASCQTRRPLV